MNKYCIKHTEEELKEIYLQNKYDEKYFHYFMNHYNFCFGELSESYKDYTDEDWEEGDSVQKSALNLALDYISIFLKLIKIGHGEEWANMLAKRYYEGDEKDLFYNYSDLSKTNLDLSNQEVIIFAKSISDDEIFQKRYLDLFKEVADPDNRIEVATNYAKFYRQALQEGKTTVYAHEYAKARSYGEYNKMYCEEFASAYDKAISEGKNDEYASLYADKYASAWVDVSARFDMIDDEEMYDFAIKKVDAFMNAWVYGTEHRLSNFARFADIYENVFLNYEHSNKSKQEAEKEILENALERFSKIKN